MEPFKRSQDRGVITRAAKFYLFDVGVAGSVVRRAIHEPKGDSFGRALEHLVFMELAAYREYRRKDFSINYWRTKTGLEVDFILAGGEVAIEVKSAAMADSADMRGLRTFVEQYKPKRAILVCNESDSRRVGDIRLVPWRTFLASLWRGEVI